MDLKQKFKSFINKQGIQLKSSPSPTSEGYSFNVAESQPTEPEEKVVEPQKPPRHVEESLADQDILEDIEDVYFTSGDFDPSKYELQKLPEVVDRSVIEDVYLRLRQQHKVVSKKVLELILQNQTPCTKEFIRVTELQHELLTALQVCREGRSNLNLAKRQFTTASLGILANYRKRQVVKSLLHSLNTIKTLQRTEEHLQELLSKENYAGAIQLLLECQGAAATYSHFTCVAALSGKLQDTLEMAEEQLDVALAKVCSHFDAEHYSKLQAAYRLLGKTQIAMDQLHMHFTSAIHNTAFIVVHGYVELCAGPDSAEINFQKKQYQELCKCVTPDSFIPCLVDLCKALWGIMRSYYEIMNWHERNDTEKLEADGMSEPVDFEANVKKYVKQKLENGLSRIWHDVQTKICMFLLGSDLAGYKFEEFLQVLDIVHRLMEVGMEFCGSKSENLQNSIRKQSVNYFKSYHYSRMDELRMVLESEGWEICPVKPNFTILQLQEFKSLRSVLQNLKIGEKCRTQSVTPYTASPDSSSTQSQEGSNSYFSQYSDSGTPFDISLDESQDEDILATNGDEPSGYFSEDSDEDIPEELKGDFVDENTGETVTKHSKTGGRKDKKRDFLSTPILTNTTLTILRFCGKYLQMMRLLKPIAFDVIYCLSQLFNYYLYAVYTFFAADLPEMSDDYLYSFKLQATLKRIYLILHEDLQMDEIQSDEVKGKVPEPHISPVVDLSQQETLHGLAERIVAVESLVFLSKQFEFLQPYLEQLIPQTNRPFLQQFYSQTVSVTVELRRPVYMCVAAHAVDYKYILTLMVNKVNWEVREVMSEHSQYVDILLRELEIFSMRMEEVSGHLPIPHEVYNILWEHVIYLVSQTFVEGFSSAKKCSNGGRGLMQLDFTQFLSKLEKMMDLRPIPNREYVENYVKAYYYPEDTLEKWLKEHPEYSPRHLTALVNCTCQNNKKTRQRLITFIEEMDKAGR